MTANPRPITIIRAERVSSMSEEPTRYASLPEDLEPIVTARTVDTAAMLVRISPTCFGLTSCAHAAIGSPERVELLFGKQSRMLAIRPVQVGGYRATRNSHSRSVQVQALAVVRVLALGPTPDGRKSHTFEVQLVEGCLLVGPLPEATS